MDKEYLQSLYTPEQQLLLFGDANYFNNQNTNNNNLPFDVGGRLFNQFNNAGAVPNVATDPYISPTYLMKQQLGMVPTGITASSAAIPFENDPVAIAQGFVRNTPSDQGTNFQFLPSANEANETDVVEERKRGGLADLFRAILGFAVPGFNFLIGGPSRTLEGIQSLNQRFRGGLDDFFDRRRYGGRTKAEALADMKRERDIIQAGIDKDEAEIFKTGGAQDKARGQIRTRTQKPAPKRDVYREAKSAFFA